MCFSVFSKHITAFKAQRSLYVPPV